MRVRGIITMLLTLAVILSSCNLANNNPDATNTDTSADNSDGVITIGFAADEFREEEYAPLIEQFNNENSDVQVQFVSLDLATQAANTGQSYEPNEYLRQVASAADTIATYYGGFQPEQTNTYFYDLTPLIDADSTFNRDDYYPVALQSTTTNGGIHWLPTEINLPFLSYNKDLWNERNLPPPDPNWSWTDFTGTLEQLSEKNGNTVNTYGIADGSQGALVLLGLLEEANTDLWNVPPEELRLDDPTIMTAIEQLQGLIDQGSIYAEIPEEETQSAYEEMEKQISDGNVGIWMNDSLSSETINNITFDVGYANVPPLAIGLWSNSQGYAISSGTEHPEAAWRWLSFLSQQPLTNDFRGSDSGMMNNIYARQSLTEQSESWNALNEEQQTMIQATLNRPVEATINETSMNTISLVFMALPTILGGEQDIETALREAQANLDEQLAQIQLTPTAVPDTGPIVIATPIPNAAPDGATTIRFGAFSGDPTSFQQAALAFQENNPDIFVEVLDHQMLGEGDGTESLASSADCFVANSDFSSDMTTTLDLQPLIDADAGFPIDDYPSSFLVPFQNDSALHGLPYTVQFDVLHYNQTVFEAAGLEPPQVDWSMDDFLSAAEQLSSGQGDTKQYGLAIISSPTHESHFFFEQLVVEPLIERSNDFPQPNFTDPEVIEAARFFVDLMANYTPHTELQGYKSSSYGDDSYQLIGEGRVGMWLSGGFPIAIAIGDDNEFTIAMAPKPLGDNPISSRNFQANGLFISAQTEQQDACWRWLKHLSTEMVDTYSTNFPARRSVLESETFAAQASPGTLEVYEAYSEALDRAPLSQHETTNSRSWAMEYYWFHQALDRALQGEDLEQELIEAQRTTEDYIECARQNEEEYGQACYKQIDPDYAGPRVFDTEE